MLPALSRHDRRDYVGIARMRWNCSSGITLATQTLACTEMRLVPRIFLRLFEHRPKANPVEMRSGIGLAARRQSDIGMADAILDGIFIQQRRREHGEHGVLRLCERVVVRPFHFHADREIIAAAAAAPLGST